MTIPINTCDTDQVPKTEFATSSKFLQQNDYYCKQTSQPVSNRYWQELFIGTYSLTFAHSMLFFSHLLTNN